MNFRFQSFEGNLKRDDALNSHNIFKQMCDEQVSFRLGVLSRYRYLNL